jgi:hypothetical protein
MKKSRLIFIFAFGIASIFLLTLVWAATSSKPQKPLATADLGDGRIFQIEGVTYGVSHRIGNPRSAFLERIEPWLPRKLFDVLEPKYPQNTIGPLSRPGLIVWVNAVDPAARTNVDCQGIRVELVDEHGDLFESETSWWFGGEKFWRVGHLFYTYPRTAQKLTMRITSWKSKHTAEVEFPNPHVSEAAVWTGVELPQEKQVGDLTIALVKLNPRTNGTAKTAYWETKSVYWNPGWEVRRGGKKVRGWESPEWIAEDPMGNRGQHLAVHQPVLRYSATFYPRATNAEATQLIATLPEVSLTNSLSTNWWNQKMKYGTNQISVLGFFPPGSYVFSEGALLTNPPVSMGPVRGGAPTGWTGTSEPITPFKWKEYDGYYSLTNSIIFLRAPELAGKERLAIRLRDDHGKYWSTKVEPQGTANGVRPFLLRLPPDADSFVAEVVVLKPIEAEFTVKVPDVAEH